MDHGQPSVISQLITIYQSGFAKLLEWPALWNTVTVKLFQLKKEAKLICQTDAIHKTSKDESLKHELRKICLQSTLLSDLLLAGLVWILNLVHAESNFNLGKVK